jgi:hypothetical protein
MIEVRELKMTLGDRPGQWEGLVGNQGSVYIRYRRGELDGYVSEELLDPLADEHRIVSKKIGGKYDGEMSTDEMRAALADTFIFVE